MKHDGRVTFYIRKEDMPKWKSIKSKPEFIHKALNPPLERVIVDKGDGKYHTELKSPLEVSEDKK